MISSAETEPLLRRRAHIASYISTIPSQFTSPLSPSELSPTRLFSIYRKSFGVIPAVPSTSAFVIGSPATATVVEMAVEVTAVVVAVVVVVGISGIVTTGGSATALLVEALISCPIMYRESYLPFCGYSLRMRAAAAATHDADMEVPLHTA